MLAFGQIGTPFGYFKYQVSLLAFSYCSKSQLVSRFQTSPDLASLTRSASPHPSFTSDSTQPLTFAGVGLRFLPRVTTLARRRRDQSSLSRFCSRDPVRPPTGVARYWLRSHPCPPICSPELLSPLSFTGSNEQYSRHSAPKFHKLNPNSQNN